MPQPRPPFSSAPSGGAGGQGGTSFVTSLVIHGAALATLVLVFEIPLPRGAAPASERVVTAHFEPSAPPIAPTEAPEPDEPVEPPGGREAELEPMTVPEAPPQSPSRGEPAPPDRQLLTVSAGPPRASADPLGAPTLPSPRPERAPRVLRPRSLPKGSTAGGGPGAGAGDATPTPPPPAVADVSPRPLPGRCPSPPYPPQAERMGWTGTVLLAIDVSAAGTVTDVRVESSSGHAVLDQAAARAVRTWRFEPARARGTAVAATVNKPIEFSLP